MSKIKILICFLIAATNFCAAALADEEWNPVSAGPVTTWTAPLCGKGKFVVQPFLAYERTRGTFNSEGHYDSLPQGDKKYQYKQQLFMQYGILDRIEIDGQIEYQENYAKRGGDSAHSSGFGDSYLFSRYCAVEETAVIPHITGLLQFKMPTGKYEHADDGRLGTDLMGADSGGGSYDLGLGLNMTKRLKPFIFHADASYSFPQEVKVDGVKTEYNRYLTYDFGAEYFLPARFNFLLEFNGFLQGDKKENNDKVVSSDVSFFAAAPGIGWSNDKVQTVLAYQRGLTGTNFDAKDCVVFTFVYSF